MNLDQVTLPSTDVARGAAFYRRLGFRQIVEDLPKYARFECPVGTTTFSLHHFDGPLRTEGVVVYFECDDLDATVERLGAAGVTFDVAPQNQPWLWREAYLRDPDGNTICLFQAGTNRRFPPWRLKTGDDAAGGSPSGYTIAVEESPSPGDMRALQDGLSEHALAATPTPGFEPLAAFARAGDGTVVGGVFALVNWTWLDVTLLWVAERLRGTGLGGRLLATIEDEGRRRGCTHAHLNTFSYQARPFYEARGYEVFGTLDDYPPGERRYFMRKRLEGRVQ